MNDHFIYEWKKYLLREEEEPKNENNEQVRYHVKNKETTDSGPVTTFDTMSRARGAEDLDQIKHLIKFGLVGKSSLIKKVINGKLEPDWVPAKDVPELQDDLENAYLNKKKYGRKPVKNLEELYLAMSDVLNSFTKSILGQSFNPKIQYWRYFKGDELQNMGILFPQELYDKIALPHNDQILTAVVNELMGADHFDAVDRGKKIWSAHHLGKEYLALNPQAESGRVILPQPLAHVHPRDLIYYPYYKP